MVALGAPLGALYIVIRPALPRELVKQIEPGMSTDQVHEILGEPQGYEGDFQWEYWRWGNAGWIEIYFDEDGFVDYVNDESIFP